MKALPVLALTTLLAAPLLGADMTLDGLTTGKTVFGPETSIKEMKGKVVYVVYWGTH